MTLNEKVHKSSSSDIVIVPFKGNKISFDVTVVNLVRTFLHNIFNVLSYVVLQKKTSKIQIYNFKRDLLFLRKAIFSTNQKRNIKKYRNKVE